MRDLAALARRRAAAPDPTAGRADGQPKPDTAPYGSTRYAQVRIVDQPGAQSDRPALQVARIQIEFVLDLEF